MELVEFVNDDGVVFDRWAPSEKQKEKENEMEMKKSGKGKEKGAPKGKGKKWILPPASCGDPLAKFSKWFRER